MNWLKFVCITVIGVSALILAFTMTSAKGVNGTHPPVVNLEDAIFPRTQVILFDNDIVRFDTSTGALFHFRGAPQGPNANGTFRSIAPAVDEDTSGFLEIQQFENATFLIDAVNGDTWILRRSNANNAAWVLVDTVGG